MKPFILLALSALVFSSAHAQPGSIDPSFTSGFSTQPSVAVEAIALQPDGKIIAVGAFYTYEGDSSKGVVRFNPDGSRDASFSVGSGLLDTYPEISGYSGRGKSVAVLTDGRILVGGNFSTYNGIAATRFVCLNTDGSINTGFNVGGGFNGTPEKILIQPDGKVLIGGRFNYYNGVLCNQVVRLLPDGTRDPSFSAPAITGNLFEMALQDDGKVLIGGTITAVGGTPIGRLARLNSDGSLDTDFVQGDGFSALVITIHVMADGRILAGGGFLEYNGVPRQRIARLMPDGSLDETFQVTIGTHPDQIRAIVQQADGKFILLGGFNDVDGDFYRNVVRIQTDGATDPTFQPGSGFANTVLDALLQPDGQLLAAGFFTGYDMSVSSGVARINTSGSTAIADVQKANFELYPNPTDGMVTIRGDLEGKAEIRVLDCAGRLVSEKRTQGNGAEPMLVDLSALAPGTYAVQLHTEDAVTTRMVVRK